MLGGLVSSLTVTALGCSMWAIPGFQGSIDASQHLEPGGSRLTVPLTRPSPSISYHDSLIPEAKTAPKSNLNPDVPPVQYPRSTGQTPTGTSPPSEKVFPAQETTQPVFLNLLEWGVCSSGVPVGLDDSGGVVVPDDVNVLGWYEGSSPLGSVQGATVIVGHRDSRVQGYGAFNEIENLNIGSRVIVSGKDGSLHTYRVSQVRFILKTAFPEYAREVFTREGPPHLTLITCGGDFDSEAGNYLSNVVVMAVPAG